MSKSDCDGGAALGDRNHFSCFPGYKRAIICMENSLSCIQFTPFQKKNHFTASASRAVYRAEEGKIWKKEAPLREDETEINQGLYHYHNYIKISS